MTISVFHSANGPIWHRSGPHPCSERKRISAVDLSSSIERKWLLQQVIVLDSLGYSRWQCLNWLLLPSVAPALAMAMLAIVAWSLSVVDVAIILGPGNPRRWR